MVNFFLFLLYSFYLYPLIRCYISSDDRGSKLTIFSEPNCVKVEKLCSKYNENDDLPIIECVHSLNPIEIESLGRECHKIISQHSNQLIKDNSRFLPACQSDLESLNCDKGSDTYFKCLTDSKENIANKNCQEIVHRIENIALQDYTFLTNYLKECEDDVKRLKCNSGSLQVSEIYSIPCLQNNILQVSEACQRKVYRLTELQSDNIKFDHQLYQDCAEDYSRYCSQFAADSGQVFHCLARQDPQRLNKKCKESLIRREKLISQDYRVSKGLMRACREDIKRTHCRKQTSSDRTVRLAQILLCLENVARNGSKITSDCEAELVEHRRMLMEDYRLSPEIVDNCKREIAVHCKGFDTGGITIHCLMKYAKEREDNALVGNFNKKCKLALENLIKKSDVGENWNVDPILHNACLPVVLTVCKDVTSGEARVINCLMDNRDSDHMTDDCEDALSQIQYFISRRFELDPQLYKACKSDAVRVCGATNNWDNDDESNYNKVLPCLYRYIDPEDKNMRLEQSCLQNLRRVMRQRALSVDLDPTIEENCLQDLGTLCQNRVKKGEEMQCLQEKYEDLDDDCQKTIGIITAVQAEHAELNPFINKHCRKIIDILCSQEAKNDEGDVMECLISHKNDVVVKGYQPCRASIEHFQIISLKDYRFSYKFKAACKPYAMRFCNTARNISDVVRCLSEQILNATVEGIKSQIPRDCKQQIKAQLFQQRENIDFDPALKNACKDDIKQFCGHVASGNAQVLECLQLPSNKLSENCEREVFKIKKQEVYDNSLDYALITLCSSSIDQFCSHYDKENVFECLRENKDQKGFNKKCRQVVMHRIVEQNSNYQLNPSLQQNCNMDINKFCKSVLTNRNKETNGNVIKCLKEQFKLSRLTNKCEKEMSAILKEQALNIDLNPLLRAVCANELATICKTKEDDSGDAEECLKDALLSSRIQTRECKVEIANMIEESQADIQVDPLLQDACALDLLNFCGDIRQGNGRHINCLKTVLETKHRLSPKCKNMLKKRLEMYKNAAQVVQPAAPEDFQQLYNTVVASPSKQYFFLILMMILGTIFIVGILCGRLNQKKYMLLKSK